MPRQKVLAFARPTASPMSGTQRARLTAIADDGTLTVATTEGHSFNCDWLENGQGMTLQCGDEVLTLTPDAGGRGIVLGRVGPYRPPAPQARLTLEATEVLTLKCGDATLDLRADGRAMLRGEDVLLRARGTQRIRAGTVAIN
ncbi:hypothetical protein [Parazoarcus communis]|uniref:DUF3540 domain-containing protein n=1 Tax=Parazoarcus communis SWub3 = DSM 12120 TaxID=1121029 RepID=A0A323UVR8_9RHOO|nr:hypothetical protein [Parazoarcus communis]NMG71624.1 hypothetical protein [Parazoarcus communis SWub3 = DSM 12120]PZA15326.1 hypothetical protein DNK49_17395 [Azoarcus communis] [Parazoarcus communis SWub3 = DSM 12120]